MKNALQLKMGQSLTMTPQLQQAIKLLQLHSLDLQLEIQQMLESNPMLDSDLDNQDFDDALPAETPNSDLDSPDSLPELDLANTQSIDQDTVPVDVAQEDNWPEPATQAEPENWQSTSSASSSYSGEDQRDIWETQDGIPQTSLQDHLSWQLSFAHLSDTDTRIAEALIDSINDDGFLNEDWDTLVLSLQKEIEDLEEDEVLAVLHRIQHLDPMGSGSRSVEECLMLQLDQLDAETDGLKLAKKIVSSSLDLLAIHDYARLKRLHRCKEDMLAIAVELIQSLTPKPGVTIESGRTEYVVPDVFVRKHQGRWQVELNPDLAPKIGINRLYADMAKKNDKSADGNYLKNNLQEAKWFLKSLHSRNDTILKVAQAILRRQRAFFDYGDEALKPMVLRDIAEEVEMHESTISRATNQKYMHTPNGVYELKFFFSSHVSTVDGGECSATAIRSMIKKLIGDEPSKKPLSDSKIANLLNEQGINVARRTVAKYREAMQIPPSNERKRLI